PATVRPRRLGTVTVETDGNCADRSGSAPLRRDAMPGRMSARRSPHRRSRSAVRFRRAVLESQRRAARMCGLLRVAPTPICPALLLGNLCLHQAILLASYLAFGVPRVENIERVLSRRLGILLMCAVSIAPVADAREQKEDDTEPEKPTPAEIPVVPVSMTHGDSPQTGPGCGRRLDGT